MHFVFAELDINQEARMGNNVVRMTERSVGASLVLLRYVLSGVLAACLVFTTYYFFSRSVVKQKYILGVRVMVGARCHYFETTLEMFDIPEDVHPHTYHSCGRITATTINNIATT